MSCMAILTLTLTLRVNQVLTSIVYQVLYLVHIALIYTSSGILSTVDNILAAAGAAAAV